MTHSKGLHVAEPEVVDFDFEDFEQFMDDVRRQTVLDRQAAIESASQIFLNC